MALEKADLTTINKYVRDVVNRVPPRPIKSHTIGTLTVGESLMLPDPPKVSGIRQPKITTQPLSKGPPPNPVDGDIWIASGVDASGTRWQFQYNAESSSAYKWEFIGGPFMRLQDLSGTPYANTVASTVQAIYTGTLVAPRAGDYDWQVGAEMADNQGGGTVIEAGLGFGSTSGLEAPALYLGQYGTSGETVVWFSQVGRKTGVAANTTVYFTQYTNVVGQTSVYDPLIAIRPVRIS